MDDARAESGGTWVVPAWAVLLEAAAIAAVWVLLERVFAPPASSRSDARFASVVMAALPFAVWIIAARCRIRTAGNRPNAIATLRAVALPALVCGLSPVLKFAFLEPRSAPSAPAMLALAVASLAIAAAGHTVFGRVSTGAETKVRPATILILLGAVLAAAAGELLLPDRPMTTRQWRDLLTYGLRDALRIAVIAALAVYLVEAHSGIQRCALLARRRLLRMPRAGFAIAAGVVSVVACGVFAGVVLERMPHVQDEIAIHFQAKVFAMGRLYADPPPLPEFFDQEFLICDTEAGKWYGKYQPGASALMAAGVPVGLEWLVHPVLSGVGLVLLFLIARRFVPNGVARLVVVLALLSPFWILTYASMMLHPGCLTVLLAGTYALVRASDSHRPAGWALAAGLLLAGALLFRPYTGLVLGGLLGVLLLLRNWRAFIRPGQIVPLLIGAVMVGGVTLAYNRALTGDMFVTPFEKYSPSDRLGFGKDVGLDYWMKADRVHTGERAARNFRINLNSLSETLLGWPTAVLLVMPLAFVGRRRGWLVTALLVVAASLPIAYTFYLFHGVVFGPRYWSETLPAWLLLMALALAGARRLVYGVLMRLRARRPGARSRAVVITAGGLLTLVAITSYWPGLLEFYGYSLWQTDRKTHDVVRAAGVRDAVVFIKAAPYHRTMVFSDLYGNGFQFNTPTLDGDIVYARDLEEQNERLMAYYPGRRFYTVRPGILAESSLKERFAPRPSPTTQPAASLAAEPGADKVALP